MSGVYTLLISVLLVFVAIDKTSGQGGPCTTQRNEPGICVPILSCGTITHLLSISPKPLPASVSGLVRRSYCGTFNNIRHVCCDPNRVTATTGEISPTIRTTTTAAPRVTSAPGSTSNSIIRSVVEKSAQEVQAGIAKLQGTLCGKSDADRVASGEDANLSEYPWICVPILSCGTITHLLSISPKPLPASVSGLVRRSYCGTFNNIHHACCDPNRVTATTGEISPTIRTTTTAASRVTSAPGSTSNSIIRSGVEKSAQEVQAGIAKLQGTLCGKSDAVRVANGEDANLSEYPWMALLVYFDGIDRTADGGGSLIHARYVLTAAHCIRSGSKRLVSVILGEHDTNATEDCTGTGSKRTCAPPIQEIDVEVAIYHKDYNASQISDDIGIVRLVRDAVITTSVKPICLPITPASRQFNLDRMIISGWGRVENGNKATILQKAVVPLQSTQTCQEIHSFLRITQKQLCAGGGNEIDTCTGDSGGPLFYSAPYKRAARYIQYGIVSAGSVICGSNTPGIYVRVEAYLPWIASNLN